MDDPLLGGGASPVRGAPGGYGIIAYVSLVHDPGPEIASLIVERVDVVTPFRVEFARLSTSRVDAPTLVPVTEGVRKSLRCSRG